MIRLIVPGEPVGKARPRVYPVKLRTGLVVHRGVTPAKTVNYETQIRERFASLYPGHVPLTCAVKMWVYAYFRIPKSASKKKREAMLGGEIVPTRKPDFDNIAKAAADSLSGLAFHDDSLVADAVIRKRYAEAPRLEIIISEMGGQS